MMRKLLISFFFVLAIVNIGSAEVVQYSKIKVGVFNSIMKQQIDVPLIVSFNSKDIKDESVDKISIFIAYSIFLVSYDFTIEDLATIQGYIDKYKEWNKKATSKGVTIQKTIGELKCEGSWKSGSDWYWDPNGNIEFVFFSQTKQKHQLVFNFSELNSSSNEYIDHDPETIYLSWKDVLALEKALNEKTIKKEIIKYQEKKKKIDEEFTSVSYSEKNV